MGIFQEHLVVQDADQEHQRQSRQQKVNLFDVGAGKLGAVSSRVDFGDAQSADQQDKRQQHPVEVAEGNHPPHQFSPPTATARRVFTGNFEPLGPSIFTRRVPPRMWAWLSASAVASSSPSAGTLHRLAIGTEPGSFLSLNSMGLLRTWRCLST